MSIYTNVNNDNLTRGQKWGSFGADLGYIAAKSAVTYFTGLGVGKIAVTAGTAAACASIGGTVLGATIGLTGAIFIGLGVAIVVGVIGTIAIIWLTDKLDDWWDNQKRKWLN